MATDAEEPILTYYDEDVVVEKTIEEVDEEPFPKVAKVEFQLRSEADSVMQVTVADTLPMGWPEDQVAFHPDHEPEKWSIENGVVIYEHELPPGDEHSTLYAVRIEESSTLDRFRHPADLQAEVLSPAATAMDEESEDGTPDQPMATDEPPTRFGPDTDVESDVDEPLTPESEPGGEEPAAVEAGQGTESEEEPDEFETDPSGSPFDVPADRQEAPAWEKASDLASPPMTRGAPSGETEEPEWKPIEDEPTEADMDQVEEPEMGPRVEEPSPDADGEEADELGWSPPPVETPLEEESQLDFADEVVLLESLIEAIHEHADEEQIEAICEGLDIQGYTSLTARVDYLNREFGEIAAYKDAIREFLDENGDLKETIDSVQSGQSEMRSELSEQREQIERVVERVDEFESSVDRVDDVAERVDSRYEELQEEVEETQDELGEIRERQSEKSAAVESLRERVEAESDAIESMQDRIEEELAEVRAIRGRIDKLDEDFTSEVQNLTASLDTLSEKLDGELADLQREFSSVREDVEDTKEWQNTVRESFATLIGDSGSLAAEEPEGSNRDD